MPRHLLRLPDSGELTTPLGAGAALDVVEEELRVRRFRVVRRDGAGGPELSAEKGHLKETGNLLFHLSLVALLLSLAGGKLWGYEGSILVTEGQGFCNSFQQYDTYSSGPLVGGGDLTPLCIDLKDFRAKYEPNLTASSFTAKITYGPPGQAGTDATIGVNDPLRVDGDRVYVTGHGFSPTFSVTLPDGTRYTDVSVPFLPSEQRTMAAGRAEAARRRLGAGTTSSRSRASSPRPVWCRTRSSPRSTPARWRPRSRSWPTRATSASTRGSRSRCTPWTRPRSTAERLNRVGAANLKPGQTMTLKDGTTIAFTGVREFAAMQFSHDPGEYWVLGSAVSMLIGLLGMLLLRRERVFARATGPGEDGGTVLTRRLTHPWQRGERPALPGPVRRPGCRTGCPCIDTGGCFA